MPVSDKHSSYTRMTARIEIVRDCVKGSDAIKSRKSVYSSNTNSSKTSGIYNIEGSRYLPPPNPSDNSTDNIDRYYAYKHRANFVNFTASTKEGFMGMIDRKKSEVDLVPGIDYMEENADGTGLGIEQLAKRTIGEILEAGAHGLLTDFPESNGGTLAQTQALRAVIKQYPRESIINWREEVIDGITLLSQVVLEELVTEVLTDGFSTEEKIYHRVLFLDDGVYKQNLYNEDDELVYGVNDLDEPDPDIIPLKSDGSTWNLIPFIFAGAVENTPQPQKPVLYDLSEINVSHYRNSADYEESSFIVGQPTPVITGLTQGWVDEYFKEGILIGSRAGIMLPEGGSAALLQANPNQMPSEGMKVKEEQMVKIGAKIIVDAGGVETAEAAKIRFAGQNSKLGTVVTNAEEAIITSLNWCMEFMGTDGENVLQINREFYEAAIDPQLIIAKMQLLDRGVLAVSDVRSNLRKAGVIHPERTDEEIEAEIGDITPLMP
ncbi:MAG: DUF4055 domain-containing protein [Gammaproteobacteria bacterium]|nr:DUF4055 domain-containing protein [Gammaproteobacteria bacterium]